MGWRLIHYRKKVLKIIKNELKLNESDYGKYYVNSDCIACVSCTTIAPFFFKMKNGNEHAYVYNQAKTPDEIDLCEEAREICPVGAIQNDGEDK